MTRPLFAGWSALLFATGFAVQWLFLAHFGMHAATRYSAFLQNLLMLFIAMYAARQGRSLTIGVAKWLGTLAPTLLFGVLEDAPFVLGLGILCSVFDLAYIGLLPRGPGARVRSLPVPSR
ncbi:hypothetical protein [Streptomyces virginiae]|uniref:hypothetical protein n=1 Tax=Streptomyces virginiae TaxID=1961 RepID=UPI003435D64C